jgi:hypothetical protein
MNPVKTIRIAAAVASVLLSGAVSLCAQSADTNLTTIAYWKFDQWSTNIPNGTGLTHGIADLATNTGQGVLTGNATAPASEEDLYVWGQMETDFQIVTDAPPASMFNRGYDGGGASWNSAHNLSEGGQAFYPQDQFGNEFPSTNNPSFTEEIFFKSATQTSARQTLIWNHQSSAYAHIELNEDGDTGDLTFWGWDGANIYAVRIANSSSRFDDGQWHCAVARFDASSKLMSLVAINQDGSSVSNGVYTINVLNSAAPNNLYIGRSEGENERFNGEINQVRMSSVALADSQLLAVAGGPNNPHIIGYWQFNGITTGLSELFGEPAILDLATNDGQGVLNGSYTGSAAVDNLVVEGPLASSIVFSNAVPPMSMFNTNYPYNNGNHSWDASQLSASSGDIAFPFDVYGDETRTPSFTHEIFFKSAAQTSVKQTLIFNHHTSAYCILQLNEDGDTGSLLFWSYNGTFPAVRITAADNGGHRFDDGQWHYAACRFDAGTLTMSLYIRNEDGTYLNKSITLGAPLIYGGSGYTFIGNDEGDQLPFNGLINQARISDVAMPDQELLALPPPPCQPPVVFTSPVSVTNYLNEVATFSVVAGGSNPQYQWRFNSAPIVGQTNASLTIFPIQSTNGGNYDVLVSTPCSGLSVTSSVAVLTVIPSNKPIANYARWSMESQATTPNTAGTPTFNGVLDSDTGAGQGIIQVGTVVPAAEDDLITFNAGFAGGVPVTNDVPPTSMFIIGNTGGSNSFFAAALGGADGALFFPQDQYGDEFDFQTSFSIELFFKTIGDQSGAGTMELLAQGSDSGNFRYGIDVNEAGAGAVTFALKNSGNYQTVSLTNVNYADGAWHYLLAKYDPSANTISLTVANENNTASSATTALPTGYSPLFAGNTGNMFIGRYNYPQSADPRNFNGMIDEVQVTSGLVTPATGQLGFVPTVVAPQITSIVVSGGTVTIKFTGSASDAPSSFALVGSSAVNGTYSVLGSAIITSLGAGNFQATIAASGSSMFYRIKR